MTEFSAEQLREVAGFVYPDKKWLLDERGVHYVISLDMDGNPFWRGFKPLLDGTPQEKAQALDCIVAAYERCSSAQPVMYKDLMVRGFVAKRGEDIDILTCALLAILSHLSERNNGKG